MKKFRTLFTLICFFDRTKSTESYMKCYFCNLHTHFPYFI